MKLTHFVSFGILVYSAVATPVLFKWLVEDRIAFDHHQDPHLWERSRKFQGDMKLTPKQQLRISNRLGLRNGVTDYQLLWPNRKIPYRISSSFSDIEKKFIQEVLTEDYNRTCLSVVPRTKERDYVYITAKNDGCWSEVGRTGGKQQLNLQRHGCLHYSTIVHEFMHAVGFEHQQSASERDDYVNIKWENVEDGAKSNFEKYDDDVVTSFDEPYDYHSVMHYEPYAFSWNGKKTIVPKQNVEIGMAKRLSDIDINKINKMYRCFNEDK